MKMNSKLMIMTFIILASCMQILSNFTFITSPAQFESEILKQNVPAVVNFYIPPSKLMCPLCVLINNSLKLLSTNGWADKMKIKLFAADITLIPALVAKYKIRRAPTLMFFANGIQLANQLNIIRQLNIEELKNVIVSNLVH